MWIFFLYKSSGWNATRACSSQVCEIHPFLNYLFFCSSVSCSGCSGEGELCTLVFVCRVRLFYLRSARKILFSMIRKYLTFVRKAFIFEGLWKCKRHKTTVQPESASVFRSLFVLVRFPRAVGVSFSLAVARLWGRWVLEQRSLNTTVSLCHLLHFLWHLWP